MPKYIIMMVLTLFIILFSSTAVAHDGWSQTNTPIIEVGEVSFVELLFGNHSNDHASYRIDGTWNPDNTSIYVTAPNGEKINISDTLFYTGELQDTPDSRLGVNNYYISSFSSSLPGAYIISVEGDQVFAHGDVASRTLRSAKSFVAVSEVPTMSYVQIFEGFDQQVNQDRAELVPLFNPAAITPDEEVSVQFLMKGEPKANTEISVIRRSTSESQTFTTNNDGIINFKTGPADYYLLRAKPSSDESVEGEFDQTYYEATMTFQVQNGNGLSLEGLQEALTTEVPNTENSVNPFMYLSILLTIGLGGTLIYAFKRIS